MNNIVDVTVYGFMESNLKKKKEKIDNVQQKVKECYESVQLPFAQEDIDRAHRIGMEYTEKNSGKKLKPIIVKFKSWSAQEQFYDARPKNFKDGKRKPCYKSFSVWVDLTKRRYMLLREARELIKNNDYIDFAFADINCSLGFRYKNGSFRYFSSENEFHNLINK